VSEEPVVKFVKPMAFAPPPPPPSCHQRTKVTPTKPKPVVQQAQIIPPKELPQEKPPELLAEAGDDEADEGGVEGGAPGGIRGGVISGVPGGVLGDIGKRLEFDENQMAKPVMVSGRQIQYTDQAIEREVEGTIVVKCVLSVDGAVRDCRVLRGLPFMDRAVVDALQSRRYRPVICARDSSAVAHMSALGSASCSSHGSRSPKGRPKQSPKYPSSTLATCLISPSRLVPVGTIGRRMLYSESPSSFHSKASRASCR